METLSQFFADNGTEVLILVLVFVKGILNLIPTQQPAALFSFLDWAIDYLVPNKVANKGPKK